jgi:hypothetical protein
VTRLAALPEHVPGVPGGRPGIHGLPGDRFDRGIAGDRPRGGARLAAGPRGERRQARDGPAEHIKGEMDLNVNLAQILEAARKRLKACQR